MKKIVAAVGVCAAFSHCVAFAQPKSVATPVQNPSAAAVGPVASARVIMLKLFVADLDRGERFYHDVFGTAVVQKMGDMVRIMIFPGGTMPGIIMIKSPDATRAKTSFVMQVANVQETLALAAANGGVLKNTRFAQDVQGMSARSSHFDDPDGNNVEVLQIGRPAKP